MFDRDEDSGKLILRVTIGALLLLHGIAKLKSGVEWMNEPLAAHGIPGFVRYGAYIGEVVAPILLILGIFSRPAGLIVAFHMLVAVLLVRSDAIFKLSERGGGAAIELELLFMLGGIAVFCLGSGKYAVSRGRGLLD